MSNTIQIKRSSTSGSVPTAGQLAQGELAVNLADEALYTKDASNAVVKLNAPSIDDKNTGATKHVTIDASGNVGIGGNTPVTKLEVSNGAITAGNSGDVLIGRSSSGFPITGAGYFRIKTNNVDAGSGGISFDTLASGTLSERARIDSSGNLLVGYTSSNGSYKLQINSQIFATSSTIATSDARYKKDVSNISGALALVSSLRPVQFSWKEHPVHNFNTDTPTIGFLAQEVKEVFKGTAYVGSIVKVNETTLPDKTKEEFLGIAEGNLIAILTAALQEQQAIITALTARVEALEAV
jgi:hypothetical protein